MSTPGGNSQLDDSVLEFIGQCVCARPVYGWGWSENGGEITKPVPVKVPALFHFQATEFFDWNDERRGGIGCIKQPEHIYNSHWLLFYTRQVGCFDFSNKIGYYNFHIGRNQPSLYPSSQNPEMAEAWPLPNFSSRLSVWGFGQIAMTDVVIANFEEERRKKWELERSAKL